MAVKIPLKMSDGAVVRTIEDLREHFDLEAVLGYYSSGRLIKWLEDNYCDEEAGAVRALDAKAKSFPKNICEIFGVPYQEKADTGIDLNYAKLKNEKLEQLRKFTVDNEILSAVDGVAFTNEDLENLVTDGWDSLQSDSKGNKVIYLCGERFVIPRYIGNITYRGVNNPKVTFSEVFFCGELKDSVIEAGIDFQNVDYSFDDYVAEIRDVLKDPSSEDFAPHGLMFCDELKNNPELAIKTIRVSAEKGSVDAWETLGWCYDKGFGVEKSEQEALKWYQKAAEQGRKYAEVQTARMNFKIQRSASEETGNQAKYEDVEAVREDDGQLDIDLLSEDEGEFDIDLLREVAKRGDADAQYRLGVIYDIGKDIKQDFAEAVKWYRSAAEQGHDKAQAALGDCYYFGHGVEENDKEAIKWYRKSATHGNADALCKVGDCYYFGYGVEENDKEAVKWYRKAAEQGNAEAQYGLGRCYIFGEGVEKDDEEALKWCREAAEQGNADAQCMLGIIYESGEMVEQDFTEAVKWYRKAAEQGNAEAQYGLGQCYYNGEGVEEDVEQAVKWCRKAAKKGDANAQHQLGIWYYCGVGGKMDHQESKKWLEKAAEQGLEEARVMLDSYTF